jgi:malonyl-CoA/methylmalonyl-CoA synthetase
LIVHDGRAVPYAAIDEAAARLATTLLAGARDLDEARVALHVPPGAGFLTALTAVWKAGGIAVPLPLAYPPPEIDYMLRDAGISTVIASPFSPPWLHDAARALGLRVVDVDAAAPLQSSLPVVAPDRRALMIYTSGTTGRPKGVVTTHANVAAQVAMLVRAWEWQSSDRTLLVLPLHHVHGLVNVLLSARAAGAVCEAPGAFEADAVWARLASGQISVFTAVPTIYHQLIAAWDAATPATRRAWSAGCQGCRLMMSGSAALPMRILDRWRDITGHVLLERYGMTEIGMALANPLHGERRPGFVGGPLPTVEVRLVDDQGRVVPDETAGELEVRGPAVFREYWGQPAATREAFRDGWFRTGDIALRERGAFRLLGRSSIDIIKTGGFKVSALEIEDVLRRHPAVADCAVVGLDDEAWGQRVAAAIVLAAGQTAGADDVAAWARGQLAPQKTPREVHVLPALPRNAMGKVVKPDVIRVLASRR